jgi:glycosyltransferase involved in cell wall biosynthesis
MASVVLQHDGLAEPGGVTVDVRNLEAGLRALGAEVVAVSSARALARELDARPAAVAHVFGCLPALSTFASMVGAKRRGRALVWTPVFHPSRPASWHGYGLLRAMAAFDRVAPHAARLADAVLAATDAEAAFFARRTRGLVEVVPPGVDEPPPPPGTDELDAFRARAGAGGAPLVLMIARDNSRKALPFGLAAFAELRRRRPDAELLLVGPDAGHPYASLPGVRCPGWLAPAEVALAYAAADVLWVSSLYEGLPRAVIEAWRAALPVVATDRVALAPTIDGEGGIVVPYADVDAAAGALERLLGDEAEARRLGARGLEIVRERFLLRDTVARTEAIYREVEAA